ncbi:hypothetical protein AAG570_005483 [Ranatra chinensis]|uniref:GB1/RHD3-type G domain-containing protein n=1 Tax=Ranatra chinensis TaxID=642074 RepID=A0ABD0XXW8_9HEMI
MVLTSAELGATNGGGGRQDAAGGEAVQVVISKPDHTFVLDVEALERLLLVDEIKDRSVVVVSVAGVFRKGKSFILDFFIRYLRSRYAEYTTDDSWMGWEDAPLEGFAWRGGCERYTTGILMWSQIFLTTLADGEKVAVVLLDTQGTFDCESTVRDCSTVFALSTMISSILVYNLSQNIQEDDLQHLQLFTEYGRLALENTGSKPFQKLQFLVRDWSCPYEVEYGQVGGNMLLERRLQIAENQHQELQYIRKHIRSCFSDIGCFLMPHPGLRVATSPKFDGRLSEIEADFKECLKRLVPMLLAPENLIVKEISGQRVKAKELIHYFKSYMNIYSGDQLPEPKSILAATAEANNLAAEGAAKERYRNAMEDVCGGARPYLSGDRLEAEHLKARDAAMEQFDSVRKMGGAQFSAQYRDRLQADLDNYYGQFKLHNESKTVFKAARTLSVFLTAAVVFYVLSGVLGLVGMYYLANLCSVLVTAALTAVLTWSYARYAGGMAPVAEAMDAVANLILENIMKPAFRGFVEKGVDQIVTNPVTCLTGSGSSLAVDENPAHPIS